MTVEDNVDKGVSGNVASVESGSASLEGFFEPDGRDFAKLTVLDGHGDNNQWTPILRLEVTLGSGDCHWEIDSESLVEETFAGMLQYPAVAKMLVHIGKLRSDEQSRFADIALPLCGEG